MFENSNPTSVANGDSPFTREPLAMPSVSTLGSTGAGASGHGNEPGPMDVDIDDDQTEAD